MNHVRACVAGALAVLLVACGVAAIPAATGPLPDPAIDDALSPATGKSTIVLAGGCFWGMEEVFQHVRGVTDVTSGYAGGSARTATYEMVSSGASGHAESVRIQYDPSKISYGQLLKVFFWVAHDPTQRNAQWPDTGPQYRSAIFYASERQQELAKGYISQLQNARVFARPIATELAPLSKFYDAEEYHQDYAVKHPQDRYIVQIDLPKLDDLRKQLPQLYVK
jgi:peptide-methionine (S)-S-oxide reductase